jgi:hypothetical protein
MMAKRTVKQPISLKKDDMGLHSPALTAKPVAVLFSVIGLIVVSCLLVSKIKRRRLSIKRR